MANNFRFDPKTGKRGNISVQLTKQTERTRPVRNVSNVGASIARKASLDALIPEDLITNLRTRYSTAAGSRERRIASIELGEDSEIKRLMMERIESHVFAILETHRDHYIGWLGAVGDFLNHPNLPANGFGQTEPVSLNPSFTFKKHLGRGSTARGLAKVPANSTFSTSVKFAPLKDRTLKEKGKIAKGGFTRPSLRGNSQVKVNKAGGGFWRHTGQLTAAYHRAMNEQIKTLTINDFKGRTLISHSGFVTNNDFDEGISSQRYKLNKKTPKGRKVRYARQARFQFDVVIPTWVGPNRHVMNAILIEPFAGLKPGGVGGFFDLKSGMEDTLGQYQQNHPYYKDLKNKLKEDGIQFYQIRDTEKEQKGLARILSPEFRRPVLRQASYQAGAKMRERVRSLKLKLPNFKHSKKAPRRSKSSEGLSQHTLNL